MLEYVIRPLKKTLAAGAVYAIAVLPLQAAYANASEQEEAYDPNKISLSSRADEGELELHMPSLMAEYSVTSDKELYDNNAWGDNLPQSAQFISAFKQDYQRLFRGVLGKDWVIDSVDIQALYNFLEARVSYVEQKLLNSEKLNSAEKSRLVSFTKGIKGKHLFEMKKHLDMRDAWRNSAAAKGEFWNHGTGISFYKDKESQGNIMRSHDSEYLGVDELLAEDPLLAFKQMGSMITIPELSDEFPVENKIPYWPGLLFGMLAPAGVHLLSYKYRGPPETYDEPSGEGDLFCFGNVLGQIGGTILFDSLHPAVYPMRIGLSVGWEGMKCAKHYTIQQQRRRRAEQAPVQETTIAQALAPAEPDEPGFIQPEQRALLLTENEVRAYLENNHDVILRYVRMHPELEEQLAFRYFDASRGRLIERFSNPDQMRFLEDIIREVKAEQVVQQEEPEPSEPEYEQNAEPSFRPSKRFRRIEID